MMHIPVTPLTPLNTQQLANDRSEQVHQSHKDDLSKTLMKRATNNQEQPSVIPPVQP